MEDEKRFVPKEALEAFDFSTREGLQAYTNREELELPEPRRDLSNADNIRWLFRNIGIYNSVPREYINGLKGLLREMTTKHKPS